MSCFRVGAEEVAGVAVEGCEVYLAVVRAPLGCLYAGIEGARERCRLVCGAVDGVELVVEGVGYAVGGQVEPYASEGFG